MANVLGELFGDIANAIREKTGDTATMKPAEFPSAISSIEVGGGGGTFVGKVGSFTGSGGQSTITHDLGVVPLLVYCFPTFGGVPKQDGVMFCAVGFSAEAAKILGITNDYGYTLGWNGYVNDSSQSTQDDPIETTSNLPICKATDTTVCIGNSSYKPVSGTKYTWYALGYVTE